MGEDGTSRSEFLVHADTVGFLNSTNGVIHAPFIFDTVNDTAILNSAIIGDATIDFAKISDTLQSSNYQSGVSGWRIGKDGIFEINSSDSTGKMVQNGSSISIYDAGGNLRVKMGKL
jgi:hypothetical protein